MADSMLEKDCTRKVIAGIQVVAKKTSARCLWLLQCADDKILAELSKKALEESSRDGRVVHCRREKDSSVGVS
jgi:hypothetical protein